MLGWGPDRARRTRVGCFGLDQARTLDQLAEHRLSYTLDEACLLAFPRRDITHAHRPPTPVTTLPAARIGGVWAATAPDGRVIALLEDRGGNEIRGGDPPATMQGGVL